MDEEIEEEKISYPPMPTFDLWKDTPEEKFDFDKFKTDPNAWKMPEPKVEVPLIEPNTIIDDRVKEIEL